MSDSLYNSQSIIIAQFDSIVGNISHNIHQVKQSLQLIEQNYQDSLIIFPEMFVSGYCPQDLLLFPDFINQCQQAIEHILPYCQNNTLIIGTPNDHKNQVVNQACVIQQGKVVYQYNKQQLPNYGVFDENRYFQSGKQFGQFTFNQQNIGLMICEDFWSSASSHYYQNNPVDLLIAINASPFEKGKLQKRQHIARQFNQQCQIPIIYANQCGAQDELIFDGASLIVNKNGNLQTLPQFEQALYQINMTDLEKSTQPIAYKTLICTKPKANIFPTKQNEKMQECYLALMQGLQNYAQKNHFKKVIIGLSGGLDSAFTLALAVDALGAENVISVMLSSIYTSQLSKDLAQKQAQILQVEYHQLSIFDAVQSVEQQLLKIWQNLPDNTSITRQNIQSRQRAVILMAMANEQNALLLATGNKSEYAMGYATLYGDMAGGYAPIIDVSKTLVYQLSKYRNQQKEIILQAIIDRPPTAELAPDQLDTDSLPPYEQLDKIIELFIEENQTADEICQHGFAPKTVQSVIKTIIKNQHKRKQATIGSKITKRAFGRDFRYPIQQQFFS